MSISAIATKELSAIGQRRWVYFVRPAYVVCFALVVAAMAHTRPGSDLALVGRRLFSMLVHGQLVLAAILCSTAASSSITSERETGALSLLFVSPLRPWQIVVGKVVACAIAVGLTVLSTLPLLALTTLYGGVSLWQVITASGCLVAAPVVGSSIGVFFSSKCKSENGAAAATFASLVVWMWVLPALAPSGMPWRIVSLSSPWFCFGHAMTVGPSNPMAPVLCVSAAVLIAGLCSLAASRAAARVRDLAPRPVRLPRKKRSSGPIWGCSRFSWEVSGLGAIPGAAGLIRRHTLIGGLLALGAFATIILWSAFGCATASPYVGRRAHVEAWLIACLGTVSVILVITAAHVLMSCSGHFIRLRSNGSLPLILATPLSNSRVVFAPLVGHVALIVPGALATAVLSLPARAISANWTASGWLIGAAWTALHTIHALAWATFALQCVLTASASYKSRLAAMMSAFLLVLLMLWGTAIVLATRPTLAGTLLSLLIAIGGTLVQLKYVAAKLRSGRDPT